MRGRSRGGDGVFTRRTAVGGFAIGQAVTLEQLEATGGQGARALLLPPESLAAGLPRCEVDAAEAEAFLHGRSLAWAGEAGEATVFSRAGQFLGVGLRDGAGRLNPARLMSREARADMPDFA